MRSPWHHDPRYPEAGGHMKMLLLATHAFVFVLGIRFAEWSARENHASAFAAGRWLRSWFVQ